MSKDAFRICIYTTVATTMTPTETVITFDWISAGEVKAAYQIEIDGKECREIYRNRLIRWPGFPPDEAATLEAFQLSTSPPVCVRKSPGRSNVLAGIDRSKRRIYFSLHTRERLPTIVR
jgi:hypothetical protein